MAETFKDRMTRALDEAAARAREIAKSISLRPNAPRLAPVPIPVRTRR